MQVLYVVLFMTTLVLYAALGRSPDTTRFEQDTTTVSVHMTAWHMGAVKACLATSCSGPVDPEPYMYKSMTDGTAFKVDRFSTRYDPATKLLVTSVNASVPAKTGMTYDAILGGLNKQTDGESSMIGVYDRAKSRIEFSTLQGIYKTTYVDVPASMAASIPDGSAAIVTHL
jgi:hypothetical protein